MNFGRQDWGCSRCTPSLCRCLFRARMNQVFDRGLAGAGKKPDIDVFDSMSATDLNDKLKTLMDGLSVKVLGLVSALCNVQASGAVCLPLTHPGRACSRQHTPEAAASASLWCLIASSLASWFNMYQRLRYHGHCFTRKIFD